MDNKRLASIEKPWLKYYSSEAINSNVPNKTVYEFLYESNKDYLDEIALEYFGRNITFGELFSNIEKTASSLKSLGVKKGDIVSICSVTTPEIIYSFYALNKLGATANIIDPRTNAERLTSYIKNTNSKYLIMLDMAYPKINNIFDDSGLEKVIVVSAKDSMLFPMNFGYDVKTILDNLKMQRKPFKIEYGDKYVNWKSFSETSFNKTESVLYEKNMPACIVYTGGTTGDPKGAVLSNEGFTTMVLHQKYANDKMKREDVFLNIMPPFIAYGIVCGVNIPLSAGMKVVLIPKFDANKFDKYIIKHRPNHVMGVPTFWEKFADSKRIKHKDLSFLLSSIAGGDSISISSQDRINKFLALHNAPSFLSIGSGMTEVSSSSTYTVGETCKVYGSCGIPLVKNNVKIVEPGTEIELEYEKEGEICITGPTVMIGYFGNEQETNKTLKVHKDGITWVHSGDIGHIDENGCVYIKDRMKRMIIRPDGHNVFPSAIEKVITTSNCVKECTVVGVSISEASAGQYPVAFIVLNEGYENVQEEIKNELHLLCLSKIPQRDIACDYIFIKEMPVTPVGKVAYQELEIEALKKIKNDLLFKNNLTNSYQKTLTI